MKYSVQCSVCKIVMLRDKEQEKATCFNCKKVKQKIRNKKYAKKNIN